MNKYIITLTPTGKFFLGGDMTFALGGEDNKRFDEQFSSYIIKSNYLPQQTSLLGQGADRSPQFQLVEGGG